MTDMSPDVSWLRRGPQGEADAKPPITGRGARGLLWKYGPVGAGRRLPRSAGRTFALLIFDGETIAFGELAETLRISRASVSTSLRMLEERGLARRVARPGDRQDDFMIAPDAFAAMLASARRRIDAVRAEIDATISSLACDSDAKAGRRSDGSREDDGPAARLAEYSSFKGMIWQGLKAVLDRIRNEKASTP